MYLPRAGSMYMSSRRVSSARTWPCTFSIAARARAPRSCSICAPQGVRTFACKGHKPRPELGLDCHSQNSPALDPFRKSQSQFLVQAFGERGQGALRVPDRGPLFLARRYPSCSDSCRRSICCRSPRHIARPVLGSRVEGIGFEVWHTSIYLSICLSIYPSIHLSMYLSIYIGLRV